MAYYAGPTRPGGVYRLEIASVALTLTPDYARESNLKSDGRDSGLSQSTRRVKLYWQTQAASASHGASATPTVTHRPGTHWSYLEAY